jgi:DNA-binding NarL/FixJ family response regulator
MMTPIRIVVAEDQRLMRRLLTTQLSLESDCQVVGEAVDGREAVQMALREQPDVVLMDLNLPLMNGAQATQRIVAQQPNIKVIILTALEELASIGRVAGAAECLDKGCTPQELVSAVRRAAASRHQPTPPSRNGGDHRAAIEHFVMLAGLTPRERAVFEQVVTTELSMQEIAAALSAQAGERVTLVSVKHTLQRVMTKLAIEPRTRAALVRRVLEPNRRP